MAATASLSSCWWQSKTLWYVAAVVGVIAAVAMLSKWSEPSGQYPKSFVRRVKALVEQASRWNALSTQDTNPLVRLIHCSYALAYASMARNLVSSEDINRVCGVDITEIIVHLEDCQAAAVRNISEVAPGLKIEGSYAPCTGWV